MATGSDEILEQSAPGFRPAPRKRLFIWGAAVALIVVLFGFARTYYLKGFFEDRGLSTLVHVHGLVMTLWFGTLLAQVLLVETGNVATHRRVGIFGVIVAVMVLVVGTVTALAAARNGVTPGPPPLVFLAIPLGDMVVFAILIALGVAYRRRGDFHKRYMLMASLAILTAAIARLPVPGGLPAFFALTDLIIIGFVIADTVSGRRLHPAFAIGLAIVIASQIGRFLLAGTQEWLRFARWITG
ncbi:MAG: hypothetical protein ABIR98_13400 [Usitatibacter sp.]